MTYGQPLWARQQSEQAQDLRRPRGKGGDGELLGVALGHEAMRPQFRVSAVDDPLERDANVIADKVLSMPARPHLLQRCPNGCPDDEDARRQFVEDETTEEQQLRLRVASGRPRQLQPTTAGAISGQLGSGQPLSGSARAFFEPRLGVDFTNVRVHTDTGASALTRQVNARAFTLGRDIFFGDGEYAPGTHRGRRLLGHELVHVVQKHPICPRTRTTRPLARARPVGQGSGCAESADVLDAPNLLRNYHLYHGDAVDRIPGGLPLLLRETRDDALENPEPTMRSVVRHALEAIWAPPELIRLLTATTQFMWPDIAGIEETVALAVRLHETGDSERIRQAEMLFLASLLMTANAYGIDLAATLALRFDANLNQEGHTSSSGVIRIGPPAFRDNKTSPISVARLAATILHESLHPHHFREHRAAGRANTPLLAVVDEIEAYDVVLRQAKRLGLTGEQIADFRERRATYLNRFRRDSNLQEELRKGNYDVVREYVGHP